MSENVTRLQYEGKEIILVATAHVSEASVTLVKETIEAEQPDSICVELDEARYQSIKDPKAWERTDVVKVIREKKVGYMVAQLIISAYQRRMAKKLGTQLGGEMMQGIQSAEELKAELVLADRSVRVTFQRIWRLLGIKEKVKLLYTVMFGDDEDDEDISEEDFQTMLEQDALESALGMVGEEFPRIKQVLIDERDQYLANKIKNAPGQKVLAVLGGAHVPGVMEEIYKEQDMEQISHVPKKTSWWKLVPWTMAVAFITLIVLGFVRGGVDMGREGLVAWWLWNGGLAALGALIALAHPLSILTAFVAAPITTLNPFLAAGWFAGLMEARVRKPTIKDMQTIPEDILSFKGWFIRNRFLKVLLVVIMANLGSSAGTVFALRDMIFRIFG
ncbi:MAG: TraB/GumN family protein [Oscillospiraceae bacterium]|nr:TraB/GumN family protein [Oscillospiraceae bacterium]